LGGIGVVSAKRDTLVTQQTCSSAMSKLARLLIEQGRPCEAIRLDGLARSLTLAARRQVADEDRWAQARREFFVPRSTSHPTDVTSRL
jgi:hypothetical protein